MYPAARLYACSMSLYQGNAAFAKVCKHLQRQKTDNRTRFMRYFLCARKINCINVPLKLMTE